MAIFSKDRNVVAKSSKPYLKREGSKPSSSAVAMSANAQAKELNTLRAGLDNKDIEIDELKKQIQELTVTIGDYQAKLARNKELEGDPSELVSQYNEFCSQFKDLIDSGRDTIMDAAAELKVEVKKGDSTQEVLSACFSVMLDNMIGVDPVDDEK